MKFLVLIMELFSLFHFVPFSVFKTSISSSMGSCELIYINIPLVG